MDNLLAVLFEFHDDDDDGTKTTTRQEDGNDDDDQGSEMSTTILDDGVRGRESSRDGVDCPMQSFVGNEVEMCDTDVTAPPRSTSRFVQEMLFLKL